MSVGSAVLAKTADESQIKQLRRYERARTDNLVVGCRADAGRHDLEATEREIEARRERVGYKTSCQYSQGGMEERGVDALVEPYAPPVNMAPCCPKARSVFVLDEHELMPAVDLRREPHQPMPDN